VDVCLECIGPEEVVNHLVSSLTVAAAPFLTNKQIKVYEGMGFTLKGNVDFISCSGMDSKMAFLWKNTTKGT